MSRSDDQRVADILDAADELAIVTEVGRDAFASSHYTPTPPNRLNPGPKQMSTPGPDQVDIPNFKTNHNEIA